MTEIQTNKSVEVLNITNHVEEALQKSKIKDGICLVHTLHTTTGLLINEFDDALIRDILALLEKIAPDGADYFHNRFDDNATSHLRSTLLGNAVLIPVEKGRLVLGTWQRILFFEFDGPRRRNISVKVTGI